MHTCTHPVCGVVRATCDYIPVQSLTYVMGHDLTTRRRARHSPRARHSRVVVVMIIMITSLVCAARAGAPVGETVDVAGSEESLRN